MFLAARMKKYWNRSCGGLAEFPSLPLFSDRLARNLQSQFRYKQVLPWDLLDPFCDSSD